MAISTFIPPKNLGLPPKAISKYDPSKLVVSENKYPKKKWKDYYVCDDEYRDNPCKDMLKYYEQNSYLKYLIDEQSYTIKIPKIEVSVTLNKWKAMEDYSFIFDGRVTIKIPEDALCKESFEHTMKNMVEQFKEAIKKQFVEFSSIDLEA